MQMNMEYWKQFENSGRIEDYLSFVFNGGRETDAEQNAAGEASDAGIYHGNRDYIKTVSGGRVRQTYQPFD